MGIVRGVGYDKFPRQSPDLHKRVSVCFNYDTSKILMGKIIRDDYEFPFKTVILLDDGRVVLGPECMYNTAPRRDLEGEH